MTFPVGPNDRDICDICEIHVARYFTVKTYFALNVISFRALVTSGSFPWHVMISAQKTVSTIVYIFQTLMAWERLHRYPFLGLYFCVCSFTCIHREPYVAPAVGGGRLGVRAAPDQLFTGLQQKWKASSLAVFTSGTKHVSHTYTHRGRAVQGFPPRSAQILFWISPASFGEFDISNTY